MGEKTGLEKARATNEAIKAKSAEPIQPELPEQDIEQRDLVLTQAKHLKNLYGDKFANAGTEEMNQEDLNTPWLVLMQSNTDIENTKPGWYYRSDTKEMMESVDVNFVYVTNKSKHNDKKNVDEYYKEYYGFFAGTNEPFRMKMKGWGLAAHRELQTEVSVYKGKLNIPMFALTIRLSSEHKEGVTKEGDKYNIDKIVCNVLKDGQLPVVEEDPDKIGFLLEAVDRFRKVAPIDDVKEAETANDYIPPTEEGNGVPVSMG